MAGASKRCVSSWTHVQKMAVLPRTEGGVLGPLMSEGHQLDTHDCPVGGSVVPTSLKQLKLKLNTADSKSLKNNSSKHLIL